MKRVTPSFTVEYRQTKRPNIGSAKSGWANAQPAPEVVEKGSWIAISAFKTTAARSPVDVVSPSIPRGRILPSLVDTSPGTEQAEAARTQSRGGGSAAKAGSATQVPGGGTVARLPGGHISSPEDREPLVAVGAMAPRLRVRHPRTRAHQTRERQDRRSEFVVLQKSTRGSILLLVRPLTYLKPHRWFQPPAWRLSTNLHRPRAQVEFSIATSFATKRVRESSGSAELKRDESVAHKHSFVPTRADRFRMTARSCAGSCSQKLTS